MMTARHRCDGSNYLKQRTKLKLELRVATILAASAAFCFVLFHSNPVLAHSGGHGLGATTTRHHWIDTRTGDDCRGTLLYATSQQAVIEREDGRIVTLEISFLDQASQQRVKENAMLRGRINDSVQPAQKPVASLSRQLPTAVFLMLAAALLLMTLRLGHRWSRAISVSGLTLRLAVLAGLGAILFSGLTVRRYAQGAGP
ncbi:MAG: hypothetical protein EBU88_18975, partial [Acidobacteria bacterium]|nr:hypothetical protein [Acidobacteriota bacterium]